jgi:TonB family protein
MADLIDVGGGVLRSQAVHVVLPDYPAESIARRSQGVAVAELTVSLSGAAAAVQMLETPDSYIRSALSAALSKWRFQPFKFNGLPVRARGRLVFYFKFVDGNPKVIDAIAAGAWEPSRGR